ncbi:MAG TPA: antibiotic biosynthesis monooxygenase [Dehalococcoidia bacterium]|nr:antibiotic biosynthesis monooxygenase [Dehalococcoidia bacterium]
MIVVNNRLTVPAEYADHLERAFAGRRSDLSSVPGFVSFDLLKRSEAGEYVVTTKWQTREDYDRWVESDAFQRAHADTNPNSPVRSVLEIYEVVLSVPAQP